MRCRCSGGALRLTALVDWRGGFKRLAYTGWVGCVLICNCPAAVD
jgi:hypothetical protein